MTISQCIAPDGVVVGLDVSSKQELLRALADEASRRAGLSADTVLAALKKREALGSTGIGAGIALPHAPVDGVDKSFCLFAKLAKPIDFEAIDDDPVDLVCVVLTPPGGSQGNLTLLSRIARQLRQIDIVAKIRRAKTADEILAALKGNGTPEAEAS